MLLKSNYVIIGAASGIGQSIYERLRRQSCNLLLVDKNEKDLIKFVDSEKKIQTICADISDSQSMKVVYEFIKEKFKIIDGLIISAGIHGTCPIEFLSDNEIDSILDVNLISHIKVIRDILPMIKDGGRIVGVSSIAAEIGIPMSSIYAASKAGLERFYESLAIEISYRNIKPIIIHPGNVNTGFNEKGNYYKPKGIAYLDKGYTRVIDQINSKHGISPHNVSKVIYIALTCQSPRFRYIVGLNAQKAHWARRLLGTGLSLKVVSYFFGFKFFI